jgi:hydroxypyruvate reductase
MALPSGDAAMEELRDTARLLLRVGLGAADPTATVHAALRAGNSEALRGRRWALLAVGKAARAMARGAASAAPHAPVAGVVVEPAPPGAPESSRPIAVEPPAELRGWPLEWRRARHPLPDRLGQLAAADVERCASRGAETAGAEAFLVLLSGGASALLPAPTADVTLADKTRVTKLLLDAGASIRELNVVRKHLSRLKGGGLAVLVAPRPALVLVISDVVDDDLSVIAGGPLHADPTTFTDAERVLVESNVYQQVPARVQRRLRSGRLRQLPETPKPGHAAFGRVHHRIVASNSTSVSAIAEAANHAGFVAWRSADPLVGEARVAAERLLAAAGQWIPAPRAAWVSGGETTVAVRGSGQGGRNQELALAFALAAERSPAALAGRSWCLLSVGTDGLDGPTDAAGGLVDAGTLSRCRAAGVDPAAALAGNDSHRALEAAGDLVRTGATGTNVSDLQVLLAAPA